MLASITEGWQKIAVWFVYSSAQILVLAALLLTGTQIAPHLVFLLLTVTLYFITALTNPGFHHGVIEPNHHDAQLSTSKSPEIRILKPVRPARAISKDTQAICQQPKQKAQAWDSTSLKDKECPPTSKKEIKEDATEKEREQDKFSQQEKIKPPASIEDIVHVKGCQAEEAGEKENIPNSKGETMEKPKFKLFQVAKSVFESFAVFKSQKNLKKDLHPQKQSVAASGCKSQSSPKKECRQSSHASQICEGGQTEEIENSGSARTKNKEQNLRLSAPVEDLVSSVRRDKGCNSAIGKEDFMLSRIQSQLQQDNIRLQPTSTKIKSIVEKVEKIRRYCRICSAYQSLRVKHCHSCEKCITTFDHHCPWLSNCIGEKNKLFFLLYLFSQSLQLLVIVIDLCRHIATQPTTNSTSEGIFLMTAIMFFITLTVLFTFHLYLLGINLTTWEFLKWNQIQYLSIFDRSKLSSPFNKGFWQNVKQLFELTRESPNKKWEEELSQDLSRFVLRKSRSAKSEAMIADTDRRPFRSEKGLA